MAGSRSDRRRVLLLAGASVAVVILGLLLLPGDRDGPPLPERASEGDRDPGHVPAVPPGTERTANDEAAGADDEQAPEAEPSTETWVVTVLGPGDVPQEGVVLLPDGLKAYETDADGRARFPAPAPGEEREVVVTYPFCPRGVPLPRASGNGSVIRLPDARPLDVVLLDGSSGEPLSGTVEHAISDEDWFWFFDSSTGRLPTGPLLAGSSRPFHLGIKPPPGFAIGANRSRRFKVEGSRLADKYRLRIPLWPELDLRVHVRERDGTPASGATLAESVVAGHRHRVEADGSNGDGLIAVRGLPTLPGETVRVTVRSGMRVASGSAVIRGFGEPVDIEVTLPPPGTASASSSSVIGIGGGAGGSFGGRSGRRGPPPTASLAVRVLRRDGQPVADAEVFLRVHKRSGRTDGEGVARFDGLRPGEEWVSVREPGYVSGPPVEVSLQNGAVAGVTIRENAGRSSFVRVLNEDGSPVVCATLTVVTENGVPYTPVVAGVQDLVHLTDRDGRAALPELPPGKVTVTATFGTRRAKGEADAGGSLVLVLER